MAWFSGKVSLGNFPDLAGAVNKLQESVKNIEKNFDSALGFEEKEKAESGNEASGLWPSSTERKLLFDPVISFMGQTNEGSSVDSSQKAESSEHPPKVDKSSGESESPQKLSTVEAKEGVKTETLQHSSTEQMADKEETEVVKEETDDKHAATVEETETVVAEPEKSESESSSLPVEPFEPTVKNDGPSESVGSQDDNKISVVGPSVNPETMQGKSGAVEVDQAEEGHTVLPREAHDVDVDEQKTQVEQKDGHMTQAGEIVETVAMVEGETPTDSQPGGLTEPSSLHSVTTEEIHSGRSSTNQPPGVNPSDDALDAVSESVSKEHNAIVEEPEVEQQADDNEADVKGQHLSSGENASDSSVIELEKVKMEMKMMEAALQGAARQAQAKADEIAKFMNENEQLKSAIEDLKRKSNDAEVESLREEYHQRVATLERKVYALTKERDTLRREQNKKSDAAALLKEKDEIINQVMAEGEELSKKQAAQGQIRKLRAQIREFEEDKKGLITKLQEGDAAVAVSEEVKKNNHVDGKTLDNELEVVEGMKLDRGYISPYFITNQNNQKCELENPLIVIHEKKISSINAVVKILELALQKQRPLLIVAEDVESEALATLILNKLRAGIKVCAIKAPGFGENRKSSLQDLAVLTGGSLITEELGLNLDKVELDMLGTCKKVTISKDDTVILDGAGDKKAIDERSEQIRSAIELSTSDYDKEKLQERLAKLSGGVAVLKIGGASETEVGEKKDRVTDALNATKAAVEEGIVPGGGVALLYASKELEKLPTANFDQKIGVQIIQNALKAPVHTIASNAGVEGAVVVGKLLEQDNPDLGYDAAKGEYVDMVKSGIIDPLKVIRTALVDAASVSSLLTTTEAVVVELPSDKETPAMGGGMGGGMGGMDY